MVELAVFQSKVQDARERIAALKKSFLLFAIPDNDFIFILDPDSREYLLPYIEEVGKWEAYNVSVLKAIEEAKAIYVQLTAATEIPNEISPSIQDRIIGIKGQISNFKALLENLKTIDPKTLETVIPPENKKRADELKSAITLELPGKIEKLYQGNQKIETLFKGLDILIPAAELNLPKRGGQSVEVAP
jgi:hypothetical protein